MLNRTGPMLILVLLFNQGCATIAPTSPAATGLQTLPAAAAKPGAAKVGEPAPVGHTALRVYKDTVTGEFISPSPETLAPDTSVSVREATSIAPIPVMQETAVEGGGTKLDLQGRFRNYMSAIKDAEGKVTVYCNDKPHAHTHEHKVAE